MIDRESMQRSLSKVFEADHDGTMAGELGVVNDDLDMVCLEFASAIMRPDAPHKDSPLLTAALGFRAGFMAGRDSALDVDIPDTLPEGL